MSNQRLGKSWEKASIQDILEKLPTIKGVRLEKDDYAYQDKSGRWRAGRLAKANTGQFVSGASARSLRGRATQLNNQLNKAKQFQNQRGLDNKESWTKSREWLKEYRKAKNEMPELTNLSSWVDEQYSLQTS